MQITVESPNKPKKHKQTPKLTKIEVMIDMHYLKMHQKYTNRSLEIKFYCKNNKMFLTSERASIAQLVEQLICNQWVGSSSLSGGTTKSITYKINVLAGQVFRVSGGTLVAQTMVLRNEYNALHLLLSYPYPRGTPTFLFGTPHVIQQYKIA